MTRAAFLAAVHELAEQLGNKLYDLVAKQSDRARAQAIDVAKAKLRAEFEASDGEAGPVAVEADRAPGSADRAEVSDLDGRREQRLRARRGGGEADHDDHAGDREGSPRARKPRSQQRCSRCVAAGRPGLGHNSRRCEEADPTEAVAETPVLASPPQKRDRFASIEAAAAARRSAPTRAATGVDGRG